MKKFFKGIKDNYSQKSKGDKIAMIFTTVLSVAIIALVILQLTEAWEAAGDIYVPLIALENIMVGYLNRNVEGSVSKFNYGIGIFLILLWAINMTLEWFNI